MLAVCGILQRPAYRSYPMIIWRLVRQCPYCGSFQVCRSHRRGAFEKLVLSMLLLRPFRCLECQARHDNFVLSRRSRSLPTRMTIN